jgi:hypothetical protein
MDAFISRQIEQDSKPPFWARVYMRFKFGPDSHCDSCGRRTWWNGNVESSTGISVVLCDHCHASLIAKNLAECPWHPACIETGVCRPQCH